MVARFTSASVAVSALVRPGDRVLLGTGAGEATALGDALVADRERLTPLHLFGGLQLGTYAHVAAVREGRWTYETWHLMAPIRDDVAAGRVPLHLARGAHVPRLIRTLAPDVFLTAVSPPGPDGTLSFGASVSYALPMALDTARVIAEVNPNMPWVHGRTSLPPERFTALVDVDRPLPSYRAVEPDPASLRIAGLVRDLVPDGATVQIGIGSVPESLVALFVDDPPPGLTLFGMGIDAMVPLLEELDRPRAFVGGELLGTDTLYRFAHDRPAVHNHAIPEILDPRATGAIDRFVSVIGALEIDLTGQVNSEVAGTRAVSGVGGGCDFVDASWMSEGGFSVITLRSTAKGGARSTIVPRLGAGAPVTIPRHSVRHVATEHGIVDLFGLTPDQRAEALISIADPAWQGRLEDARRG